MTGEHEQHLLRDINLIFTFNLSSSRLAAVWIASGYSIKNSVSLHFSGRFSQAPCPSLSDCSVNQTQGDTLETDQDVTGSERLNVGTLERPTVIQNISGILNYVIFLVIQNMSHCKIPIIWQPTTFNFREIIVD